jgi:hypothetical protein
MIQIFIKEQLCIKTGLSISNVPKEKTLQDPIALLAGRSRKAYTQARV